MNPDILLVDDNPDDAELFRLAARQVRFSGTIRWAESGEAALALLIGGDFRPGMIILDIRMPGLDGLEVLRRLRGDPAHRNSLVVILTGSDLESERSEALRLGCDHFITKPATLEGCISVAETVVGLIAAAGAKA
jgi:CheY-like chemotaxis protein